MNKMRKVVTGKPKSLEKTLSHCHSVHHKSSTDWCGIGLCSEAVSNCLSHGLAAAMLSFVAWAICLYHQQPTNGWIAFQLLDGHCHYFL